MVEIFIIGVKGHLRSRSLEQWSSSDEYVQKIHFVDPVSYTRKQVPRLLDLYTGLHYGNRLTDGEWGCSLAHLSAQTLALSTSSEWSLFLEDDARISDNFTEDLRKLVSLLPLSKEHPLGIHCFSSMSTSGLSRNPVNLEFSDALPPLGAVGYFLNRASLELATRSHHRGHPVGKADYPAWSHQVAWAIADPAIVFHEEDQISLVGPRKLASRHRSTLFKMSHATMRVFLFFVPFIKIHNRLSWELDFILKRTKNVRLRILKSDKR
jgi:GR25 family glycosyltransferase involved in LPS biosynthesis